MGNKTDKSTGFMSSIYRALFGDFPRENIAWDQARFSNAETEQEYRNYVVENDLPKERLVNFLCIALYAGFAVLDIIAFDEMLPEVLTLRLGICTPIAIVLVMSTYLERVKPHFQWMTGAVLLIGSGSVVLMIGMMGPEGGPPYIVGILTVLIVYACLQRLDFPFAASVYAIIFAAYSATIIFISPKSPPEIAAGHFFMVTITLAAVVTSYTQEARSRIDFFRRRQREMDAAFIEKLLIEATAADRAKISFLSILSHELRTPLHQIVGFSEVVKNQVQHDPSADPSAYLNEIHSSASGLLSSISKMLRYADATAGKISYDAADCSVKYLLETVVDQARTKADRERVQLDASGLENAVLHIDHLHTAYALGQLLDNAIAASQPNAKVQLRGRLEKDGAYTLEVVDEGCGMSKEQIAAAFAPFMQSEDYKTRTMEGVGLGLTLSNKILEDQDAQLTLQSEVGAGTNAIVRFAPQRVKPAKEKAVAAQ